MSKMAAWLASGMMFGSLFIFARCNFEPVGTGGGPGGGGPGGNGGGDGGPDGVAADAAGVGALCVVLTSTPGTNLCEEINLCPGVAVNQNTFAGCGFDIHSSAIDLECECSGYLCSAGTTSTCAALKTILATESSTQICNQLSTLGACVLEGFGSTPGSGTSACNSTCAATCNGDPNCTAGCGC